MPPPKKRPPLTHFLCLPLTGCQGAAQWKASLRRITNDVVANCPVLTSTSTSTPNSIPASTVKDNGGEESSIPVKAIRPLGTLHLTIGVMSLKGEGRVEGAVECLRELDLGGLLGDAKEGGPRDVRGKDDGEGSRSACNSAMDPAGRATLSGDPTAKAVNIDVTSLLRTDGAKQHSETMTATDFPSAPAQHDQNASFPPPLTLSFTGLKSMQSPKSTSLLYAPPTDTTGRLYPFCQSLKDRFTAEGFMAEEERALKLHATILNTIYAGKVYLSKKLVQGPDGRFGVAEVKKSDDGDESGDEHHEDEQVSRNPADGEELVEGRKERTSVKAEVPKGKKKGKKKKQVVKFDARDLIKRYVDFEWAKDVRIEKVAICEMGAKKMTDEKGEVVGEEYTEIASVPLP